MDSISRPAPETELDWARERALELGSAALELWGEYLGRLRELPVAQRERATEVAAALARDVPEEPAAILAHVRELMLERSVQVGHPGFMACVTGAGTVPGAAADLLAAAVNQNVGGYRVGPGAAEIEVALARWLAARFGLPAEAIGMMVTGGSIATFVALKLARDWQTRAHGLRDAPPLAVYRSGEGHLAADRAWDIRFPPGDEAVFVGLGNDGGELGVVHESSPQQLIGQDIGSGPRYELFVHIDDVDALLGRLREAGVPVLHEPEDMPWGERLALVADPEGNPVTLAVAA